MNDFGKLRAATIARLREHREGKDRIQVAIDNIGRSESMPVGLLLDANISPQAVRAWGILRAAGPVAYLSNGRMAQILGGAGGATNATDELYLFGWITKEVVRGEDGVPIGTAYVLFSIRRSWQEMLDLEVGWDTFVRRLASRAGAHYSRLAKIAIEIIDEAKLAIASSELRTRNCEGNLLEEKRSAKKEPAAEGGGKAPARQPRERSGFIDEFGFEWQPAWERYLSQDRALGILLRHGVRDAEQARRVIAEWAASGSREFNGFDGDAALALGWACKSKNELAHTAAGDERMAPWA